MISPDGGKTGATVELSGATYTESTDEPGVWTYRPTAVVVAPGPGCRQLHLLDAGPLGLFSITTQLGPDPAAAEAARQSLRRPGRPDVRLVPSAITVLDVSLLLRTGSGPAEPIGRSTGSGTPPYAAVFSCSLTRDQLAAVRAALAGEPGRLSVRYVITDAVAPTPTSTTSTTTSSSSSTQVIVHQNGGADPPLCVHHDTTEQTDATTSDPRDPRAAPDSRETTSETTGETVIETDAATWSTGS